METSWTTIGSSCTDTFAEKVEVELNRAERYRVFVSLTVLDLSPAEEMAGERTVEVLQDVAMGVKEAVRTCDYVALLYHHCLAVLLPETPRQGAEVASRRLADIARTRLMARLGQEADQVIPVEIASYPDTAGARTLGGFLEELAKKGRN
jgi:GGDEF domain-containing protein